jgi:hypothetical protein
VSVADGQRAAVEKLQHVSSAGVRWLLDHIADTGEPAAAQIRNGYYRLPWTLAAVGERATAARVLSWIEDNALTESGDLRLGPARADFTHRAAAYPLSILAQGAWALERYDTALAIMATLRRDYQDPASGGAYMERPEFRTGRQFIFPTAQMGLAALTTGQRDMADGVFTWFLRLLEAQPELPDVLYASWGPDGLRLVADMDDEFHSIVHFSQPRQAFYNPGIAAAFLARYHMVSADPRASTMASSMVRLSELGTEAQFDYRESMQICKVGWGAAMTHEIQPGGGHDRQVARMADWYVASQRDDGSWVPSGFLVPEPNDSHAIEKTAEHVLWVEMMAASLAGRRASVPAPVSGMSTPRGR